MAIVQVHPIVTTPAWWEIAGYHPREITVRRSGWDRETVMGCLKDDGVKPEGAARKPARHFSISYRISANLTDVAHFLGQKVEAGDDLGRLFFN